MTKIHYRRLYRYALDENHTSQTLCKGLGVSIGPEAAPWLALDADGTLHIREGYSWDGPSGPARDTANFMRASLVHDALYQLIEESLLPKDFRKLADKTMREICKEDGMGGVRRWYTFAAVRAFGGLHT
jgi:hypothetical protein